MEIILLENILNLGNIGDKVTVKNGYGRNYIIPQGLGVLANKSNTKVLEENLKQTVKKQEEILKEAQKLSKKIGNLVLDFKLKSGSDDKVFGSITTAQIAKLLSEKGIEIHKKNITILTKVNAVGEYDVELKIHKDITHPIKINVTGDISSKKKSTKIKKEEDVVKDDNKNVKNSEESKDQDITSKENSDESQPEKSKKDTKKS